MTILIVAWASQTQHPYLGAFIMIVLGAVVFLVGFRQYREYRILADAPKAKVRSMPMGLVHLHGKATGEPLTSPLTGSRCFAYVANVEEKQWTTNRKGETERKWVTVAGDDDLKPFYLDDGTGRVLVNPFGAEEAASDSPRTFYCEIGKDGHFKSVSPAPGISAPSEQVVWAWIHGNHSRKVMDKTVFATEAGRQAKAAMESSLAVLGAVPGLQSLGGVLEGSSVLGLKGGPYRVTENCFLAESDCVIVGTCAENPDAKGEEDRNIIRKGENEKTFLISTQGEKKVGRSLRLQAFGLVFLGATLILGGFALALNASGLL